MLVGGSLVIGQALFAVCGRREWTLLAGPVGLAVALVVAGAVAGLGGRGAAVAIALGALLVVGLVVVRVRVAAATFDPYALGAALLAILAASIPFIASGHVGILGVGLVNDDMASHLLLADWIDERFRPEPVLIDQGDPLGPHALVAGLAKTLGASSIDVFAGLTLAIPALTALVALPYLAAAYRAQEAFKEPIMALFLLAFALLLAKAKDWRDAIPLGVLAAGTTYVYSFPGLAWLGGVAGVWGAIELWRHRRTRNSAPDRENRTSPLIAASSAAWSSGATGAWRRIRKLHAAATTPNATPSQRSGRRSLIKRPPRVTRAMRGAAIASALAEV